MRSHVGQSASRPPLTPGRARIPSIEGRRRNFGTSASTIGQRRLPAGVYAHALSTAESSRSYVKGLAITSNTPSSPAGSGMALEHHHRQPGQLVVVTDFVQECQPFITGIIRSSKTTSGRPLRRFSRASSRFRRRRPRTLPHPARPATTPDGEVVGPRRAPCSQASACHFASRSLRTPRAQ